MVGDSLEVGSGPYLRGLLPGVRVDASKGRTSGQGVVVLERELALSDAVIVFPLGTNDSVLNPEGLAASLAAVGELAGDRCVVVATIARPRVGGVSAAGLNRVVTQFAADTGAQVADWLTVVQSIPGMLVSDRVHGTGEGYSVRATLLAEAVQSCAAGAGGGVGIGPTGLPAPRDPNAAPPEREAVGGPPLVLPFDSLAALGRLALRPIAVALQAAQTAATKAGPEPVLGAP